MEDLSLEAKGELEACVQDYEEQVNKQALLDYLKYTYKPFIDEYYKEEVA